MYNNMGLSFCEIVSLIQNFYFTSDIAPD